VIVRQPLRAPQHDSELLSVPSLTEVATLLDLNRRRANAWAGTILDRTWSDLRSLARQSAIKDALDYLEQAGEPLPSIHAGSLIVSGHQPELFHPGVWVKNFAIHQLAQRHQATPLHLIVDNDAVKHLSISVPMEHVSDRPHALVIPFDRSVEEVPYEERVIVDHGEFASFVERVGEQTRAWPFKPILPEFWTDVLAHRSPVIGERFSAARRTLERRWGCRNLEVPLSHLCRSEPFAWFTCHLLSDLPHFHAIYNQVVHDYRRVYGIRSRNHPVPDLGNDDRWFEAPFWIWDVQRPRRRQLWVQQQAGQLLLRAANLPGAQDITASIPTADPDAFAWALQRWESHGVKLRTRALTTTLYARLFLADLFLHGIGGGKYDELTDEIARKFYNIEPPAFLVLSATLHLPLASDPATTDDQRRLQQECRDLHWNPQRHVDGLPMGADTLAILQRRQAMVDSTPTDRRGRRERFTSLRNITEQMRPLVADKERRTAGELARVVSGVKTNAVLQRRDYAFCLFPGERLQALPQLVRTKLN
jgi:hypothetical protein